MNAFYSLFLVFALVLIALFGVGAAHMSGFFATTLPYVAAMLFVLGFAYRVVKWAKSPVPFRIPTTAGQQKSFDWIEHNPIDNPSTMRGTVVRMILEVALFRSLFRNTKVELHTNADGETVVAYKSSKWLWLFSLMFHYSFLIIFVRHMRLFLEPVPGFVGALEFVDGIFQISAPVLYMTDVMILAAVSFLFLRRILDPKLRYISLAADYFPLFLIFGIALSGVYMRYVAKVDVVAIKELTMGLVQFHPVIPAGIDISFFIHLFLVCVLLIYFPLSKLMHMGGVFLSPTRNQPNDTRINHYSNPWNKRIQPHSYEAYEDDFREAMVEAGLPVDKPLTNADSE